MMLRALVPVLASVVFMSAWAAEGVTDTSIKIGQAAALTGPAAGLGMGMQQGLQACFTQVNAAGGVNGRKLELVSIDDAYDPDQAVEATTKLIKEDKVFCLAGYVGTPTAKVVMPIVSEAKVPIVGLFTGAMLLRQPVNQFVLNVRASYDDETEALVEHLTKDLSAKSVAVFYQNDSFGQAGLSGTDKALKKRGMEVVAKGTFERGTVAVKSGLAALLPAKPDAVIMVGTYKPVAAFLKEAKEAGLTATFCTVSFVGTENLIAEAGLAGDGVVISQVVPSPQDASVPVVKDYQAALAAVPGAKPGYVSLEGYVSGRVLVEGLKAAGKALEREALVSAMEGMKKLDVGGMPMTYAADDHQGSDAVYMTIIKTGAAVTVQSLAK